MQNHVPLERLLFVAETDDAIFTTDEFTHVKICSECFTDWSELLLAVTR
jgi:hypothetical protein